MKRFILLQYKRSERSDDLFSATGTFDNIKEAQFFAGIRLNDCNEIVDTDTWQIVWRLNTHGTRL
jgi:hypothetical protein